MDSNTLTEIFKQIKVGEPLEGVVKKLRDDRLGDAALQTQGFQIF